MVRRNTITRTMTVALRWFGFALVFLATLELCARVEDAVRWGAPVLRTYSHIQLVLWDSDGIRNRPNSQFEKWRINSHGFRGPEIVDDVRPGVTRIVVLGASETFGLFESEGREYPAQLRLALDSLGEGRFEVINASMAGLGVPTMAPYYRQFVAWLKPDMVLVYPAPSFYLDREPPRPIEPLQPEPRNGGARGMADLTPRLPSVSDLRLAARTRSLLRRFIPPAVQSRWKEVEVARSRRGHEPGWIWDSVPADRVELFADGIAELVETIESSGALPVLVTHANRLRKPLDDYTIDDHRHLTAMLAMFPRATPRAISGIDDAANEALRRIACDRRIPVIDVQDRIPPSAEFFADYAHFTDLGAALMARHLADGVLDITGDTTAAWQVCP